MQIQTIRKGFQAFECKFELLERDSRHSNPNPNHSKGIQRIRMQVLTIRMGFKVFECNFEPVERDSKHSNPNSNFAKGIRSIRIPIKHSNPNSNDLKGIRRIRMQILTILKDSKQSIANCKHLNQIQTFECKFAPFK